MPFLLLLFFFLKPAVADESLHTRVDNSLTDATGFLLREAQDANGFARCDYDIENKSWSAYETAWHTGQLALAYYKADEILPNSAYKLAAEKAAKAWLGLFVRDPNSPIRGYLDAPHGGAWPGLIVTATITDGAPGIYEYYLRSKDPLVIEVFDSLAQWMLSSLWVWDEDMFFDFVDRNTGKVIGSRRDIYELRTVARPNIEGSFFRLAWKLTGKNRYRQTFEAQCKTTLREQGKNGLFLRYEPNIARTGYVHPRFNLWYAEALLECHEEFGEERYLKAAKRTLDTYAEQTDASGRVLFPDKKGKISEKDVESACAFAFSGKLFVELAARLHQPELYQREIAAIASWLLATQLRSSDGWDPALQGAYRDVKKSAESSVFRDLGTIFGTRFLAAYRNRL